MDIWNNKFLPCPAISTYKTDIHNIDLNRLLNICRGTKTFLEDNKYMKAEYLTLSIIIYRMKQKFRSSKDFKTLEKVYKCVKLFVNLNLAQHLETFIDLIPTKYEKETYLPSKSLLDYILVRFQGIVKLLEKIVEHCKETAYLLDDRIKIGHSWKVAFISYSIVSRLYILAKYTANEICECYGKLISFSRKLQSTNKWLPAGYTFPDDLKQWLNVNWLDDDIQIIESPSQFSEIIRLYDLLEDSDIEVCDEYIIIQEDEESNDSASTESSSSEEIDTDEDISRVLELDPVEILPQRMRKRKLLSKNQSIINNVPLKKTSQVMNISEDVGEIIELDDTCENVQVKKIKKLSSQDKRKRKKQKMRNININNKISVIKPEVIDIKPKVEDVIEIDDTVINEPMSNRKMSSKRRHRYFNMVHASDAPRNNRHFRKLGPRLNKKKKNMRKQVEMNIQNNNSTKSEHMEEKLFSKRIKTEKQDFGTESKELILLNCHPKLE